MIKPERVRSRQAHCAAIMYPEGIRGAEPRDEQFILSCVGEAGEVGFEHVLILCLRISAGVDHVLGSSGRAVLVARPLVGYTCTPLAALTSLNPRLVGICISPRFPR